MVYITHNSPLTTHKMLANQPHTIAACNARLAAVHSLFTYAAIQHLNTPHRSREYWPSRPSGASAAPTSPT